MTFDQIDDALRMGKPSRGVPVNSDSDVAAGRRAFFRWLRGQGY